MYRLKGACIMSNELIERVVLGRMYDLQDIYDLIEDYCIENGIDGWKHKVRALLEEQNGVRSFGKYPVTFYRNSTYKVG
jgi:hypothetical protein